MRCSTKRAAHALCDRSRNHRMIVPVRRLGDAWKQTPGAAFEDCPAIYPPFKPIVDRQTTRRAIRKSSPVYTRNPRRIPYVTGLLEANRKSNGNGREGSGPAELPLTRQNETAIATISHPYSTRV
ncbi:hypothetical protein EVAR_54931_1 [Eumeta japonica]|uniref:Uncharacterized protein n=1 Tax=Eumeta variegata TaxID=151549 RepID=A0A4C1YFH9_EUMVA|nr:hypothetical protein EVAR_54931_1 [Eumeta japonica]